MEVHKIIASAGGKSQRNFNDTYFLIALAENDLFMIACAMYPFWYFYLLSETFFLYFY